MPELDEDEIEVEYYPTLSDKEDNSVAIDAMNGTMQETLCLNTVVPAGWYVFTAPFDIPEQTAKNWCAFNEVREFVGSSYVAGGGAANPPTIKLFFDVVTDIKAGVPYLVKTGMERDFYIYTFSNVTVNNVSTTVESKYAHFIPTLSRTLVTDDPQNILFAESPVVRNNNVYTYYTPVPYHPEAPAWIKGFSGYFWLTPEVEKVFPDGGSRVEIIFGSYEPEAAVAGDANGDGKVDVDDVVSIVNYILGEPDEGFNASVCDINGDGKIDIEDVVALINIILGIE